MKSAHGIKGELYIQLLSKKADWLEDFKVFALRPRGKPDTEIQSFNIKRVKPHKQGLILLPESFSNRNQSEEWKGADFFIDKSILATDEGESPYLVEFEGFKVKDVRLGFVGRVVRFQDNGAQDLFVVEKEDGSEVLIPFVDPWIKELNKEAKEILMDLPEGLVDAD